MIKFFTSVWWMLNLMINNKIYWIIWEMTLTGYLKLIFKQNRCLWWVRLFAFILRIPKGWIFFVQILLLFRKYKTHIEFQQLQEGVDCFLCRKFLKAGRPIYFVEKKIHHVVSNQYILKCDIVPKNWNPELNTKAFRLVSHYSWYLGSAAVYLGATPDYSYMGAAAA